MLHTSPHGEEESEKFQGFLAHEYQMKVRSLLFLHENDWFLDQKLFNNCYAHTDEHVTSALQISTLMEVEQCIILVLLTCYWPVFETCIVSQFVTVCTCPRVVTLRCEHVL